MMAKNGLILLTPTTVDKAGTGSTATINANGSVTFSSCQSVSLNGVFSADYDNYTIVTTTKLANGVADSVLALYLRSNGTDTTGGSDYNSQSLVANGTTVSGSRATTLGYWYFTNVESSSPLGGGSITHIYGPYLSQPTAYRVVSAADPSNAYIGDSAGTHELSSSYDGFSIAYNGTGPTISGTVAVYGLRN